MTLAWAATVGDHTDKLVLLSLADNANDAGECYPSLTSVAKRCEISKRTAIRAIQSLAEKGHLTQISRPGRNSTYHIHPNTSDNVTPVSQSHQCTGVTSVTESPTGDNVTPLPLPYKPSPSENRHKPSARRSGGRVADPKNPPDEPPPSNLNVEAWHRWEQYRRQIRKPIHPASWLSAQRKLAAFGTDQEPVVEQSIANGWQGLFPLKDQPKPQEEPRRGLPVLRV